MSNPWPRITVVTPTYERVEFLEECIESVLSQNYPNLEYIICDGGSKNPELLALLRRYEGRIAWWDSVPDRGHAEAIRRGFDRSTGQILAWLCSDDFYLPGALRSVGTVFRECPAADIVYGHSQVVNAAGQMLKQNRAIPYIEWAAFTTSCLYQPASFWTREIYYRVGGKVGGQNWENVVYEPNVELFCRFQKAKARFVRVPTEIVAMRSHAGTVNAQQTTKVKEVSLRTFQKYYPIYGHEMILPLIFSLMRIYQVIALILQGDFRFVLGAVRKRLLSVDK